LQATQAPRATLISRCSSLHLQPGSSLCCETTDAELVHHVMCPFTPQLLLKLIVPTPEGMARLSLFGCLHSKMVCPHEDGRSSQY